MQSRGVTLAGEEAGEGIPVVLLHGLTATRRYVVMGSRALERSGHRVVAYDARGHGASSPAPDPDAYDYDDLVEDLRAVLDDRGIERAVLAGASMGAHTAVRLALDDPARVAGLVIATPAFDPEEDRDGGPGALGRAVGGPAHRRGRRLRRGLRRAGRCPSSGTTTIDRVLRQRLGAHEHPEAVADALHAVPRSRPFEAWDELARDRRADGGGRQPRRGRPRPSLRDRRDLRGADPRRASCSPRSPAARRWPGRASQLSKVISELAERAGAAGP